jgi:hypothetical protein
MAQAKEKEALEEGKICMNRGFNQQESQNQKEQTMRMENERIDRL